MKIVSTSYTNTPAFKDPEAWLDRISFYTGILEELAKQHEVESIEQINFSGKLERNNVTYHFLDFGSKKNHFPFKLHRYVKQLNPDVVFVNGFVFPLQIIQLRVLLGSSIKIIILHRAEKPFTGIKKYLQQIADKTINAYFFSSEAFGKEWMKHGIIKNKKKIYEIIQASSSFFPLEKNTTKTLLKIEGSPVFLWVGRLNKNKDPLTVIKAFKKYLSLNPSACLYMIYQTEELIDEAKQAVENNEAINLVGKIEHKNLQYWYSSADFIISGSHYEGSGIAVSEAMSCGCIPVVTNIESFTSMTGGCGILYEPGNEHELYLALIRTKELDVKKEKEKVLHQFNSQLSFQAIAHKIELVIKSL